MSSSTHTTINTICRITVVWAEVMSFVLLIGLTARVRAWLILYRYTPSASTMIACIRYRSANMTLLGFWRFGNVLRKQTKAKIDKSIATNSHCPILDMFILAVVLDIAVRLNE